MIKVVMPRVVFDGIYDEYVYIKTTEAGMGKLQLIDMNNSWNIIYFEQPSLVVRVPLEYINDWLWKILECSDGYHIASSGLLPAVPRFFYNIVMDKDNVDRKYFNEEILNMYKERILKDSEYESYLDNALNDFSFVTKLDLINESRRWRPLLDMYMFEVDYTECAKHIFLLTSKNKEDLFFEAYSKDGFDCDAYLCPGVILHENIDYEKRKTKFAAWAKLMEEYHELVSDQDEHMLHRDCMYPKEKVYHTRIVCNIYALKHFVEYVLQLDPIQYYAEQELMSEACVYLMREASYDYSLKCFVEHRLNLVQNNRKILHNMNSNLLFTKGE